MTCFSAPLPRPTSCNCPFAFLIDVYCFLLYFPSLCFLPSFCFLSVFISVAVSLAVSYFNIVPPLISHSTGAYKGISLDPWVGGTALCGWERAWGCLWLSLPAGLMPAVQMWMNVAWAWQGVIHGRPA